MTLVLVEVEVIVVEVDDDDDVTLGGRADDGSTGGVI